MPELDWYEGPGTFLDISDGIALLLQPAEGNRKRMAAVTLLTRASDSKEIRERRRKRKKLRERRRKQREARDSLHQRNARRATSGAGWPE